MSRIQYFHDKDCKRLQIGGIKPNKDEIKELNDFFEANPEYELRMLWYKGGDMGFVTKLKNIKKLNLEYSEFEDLSFLENFPDLEELEFAENRGKYDIEPIKNLTKLRFLDLDTSKNTKTQNLSHLNGLKELETLGFKGKFKKNSLILDFPKLTTFAPKLEYVNLEEIGTLTHLESFQLLNQKVASLNFITKIPSVKYLNLNSITIENAEIITPIFDLPNLQVLNLSYIRDIENFEFVKPCKTLKKLNVWTLNDLLSLSGIEKLTDLEYFYLCGEHQNRNKIDFSAVKKLKNLKEIDIKVGTMSKEAEAKLEGILKDLIQK